MGGSRGTAPKPSRCQAQGADGCADDAVPAGWGCDTREGSGAQ